MTGAPRSAYADDDFVMIRGEAVRALGDYHSAGVFQRIAWRCERDGKWKATVAEIAAEVWLTEKQVRRAVAHLRTVRWIAGKKTHPLDNTLTWRVLWSANERPLGHMDCPVAQMDAPCGADVPYRKTETTAGDMGSAEPTACDPDRLAALSDLLRDADCDLDAATVWALMVDEDNVRFPDAFAASKAECGELDGYLRARGWS